MKKASAACGHHVRTAERGRRRAPLTQGADMSDHGVVQDDRGSAPANPPTRTVDITPEVRGGAVGSRAPAAAPTAEDRLRAVLSVLASGASCAQEALRCGVAEADVERWTRLFVDSGRRGLVMCGQLKKQPSTVGLGVQNAALKSALRKAHAELRSYRRAANGLLGPFAQVEEIRRKSEITISRFCVLIGVSRRTYCRRLELLRSARPPKSERDSASIMSTCAQLVDDYMARHPDYGYRRIHELMIADGHLVSASTVLRAIHVSRCHASDSVAQRLSTHNPKG
jgi:transposase-like protein